MHAQSARSMGLSRVCALSKGCAASNDFSPHLCNLLPPQPRSVSDAEADFGMLAARVR